MARAARSAANSPAGAARCDACALRASGREGCCLLAPNAASRSTCAPVVQVQPQIRRRIESASALRVGLSFGKSRTPGKLGRRSSGEASALFLSVTRAPLRCVTSNPATGRRWSVHPGLSIWERDAPRFSHACHLLTRHGRSPAASSCSMCSHCGLRCCCGAGCLAGICWRVHSASGQQRPDDASRQRTPGHHVNRVAPDVCYGSSA